MMIMHMGLILAQALDTTGDSPVPVVPHRAMSFTDLQSGLRQSNNGNDHTFVYGFFMIAGLILLALLLAHVWRRWSLDDLLSEWFDVFGGRGHTKGGPALALAARGHLPVDADRAEKSHISIMCPNLKCRCILVMPEEARGKNVRCGSCKQLVHIPLMAPQRPPYQRAHKHPRLW